jgi:hypothetical protein
MKKILFLMLTLCAAQLVCGQVYEGLADYNKKAQPAIIGEYRYPQETVEKTLTDKLEHMGLKVKSSKGFLIVNNAVISSISSKQMDYAFKIERKSKREKDVTVVSMVINLNDANTIADNSSDAKTFLKDLAPSIDGLHNDNMVNDQYTALTKAQKKLKNLQDDQASMEKKVRNLQDDLKTNEKDQADQQKEIQRQQEILDAMKAKKTGN